MPVWIDRIDNLFWRTMKSIKSLLSSSNSNARHFKKRFIFSPPKQNSSSVWTLSAFISSWTCLKLNSSISSCSSYLFLTRSNSNSSLSISSAFLRFVMMFSSTSVFCSGFFSVTLSSLPINLFPERAAFLTCSRFCFEFSEKDLVSLAKETNHQVVMVVLMVQAVLLAS